MLDCVRATRRSTSIAGRMMSFAGLRYYQNTTDAERAQVHVGTCQDKVTDVTTPLVFFTLEMNRIEDARSMRSSPRMPILPATSRSSTGCARCGRTSSPTSWRSSCTTSRWSAPPPGTSCSTRRWPGSTFTVEGETTAARGHAEPADRPGPGDARGGGARALAGVRRERAAVRADPQHAGQGKGDRGPLAQDADARRPGATWPTMSSRRWSRRCATPSSPPIRGSRTATTR